MDLSIDLGGLSGRVIVITGGARGIGRALGQAFLDHDSKVIAIDRSWPDDSATHRLAGHPSFLPLSVDVTDDAAVAGAYQQTLTRFGTVDVIVNNAAMRMLDISPHGRVDVLDTRPEDWRRMLDTNVVGPVRMIQHFIPPLLEKRRGSIVNVSSGSGIEGLRGDQPYGASKAALTNLTKSLARELAPHNIAINTVYPPSTASTGARERQAREREEGGGRGWSPLLMPESMAPVVLFLATRDASVTGRVFNAWHWNLEHGLGGMDRWAATPEDLELFLRRSKSAVSM